MTTFTSPFELVWMASQAIGTPHASAVQSANPDLRTHTFYYPQASEERGTAWRNGDRNIRNAWRDLRGKIIADAVLFFDWDVFANVDLAAVIPTMPAGVGMLAARVFLPVRDARSCQPFSEVGKLPRDMAAVGVEPLGCMLLTRGALDALLDPIHDPLFNADVFSELRLPSVVTACGYQVSAMDLPHLATTPMTVPAGAKGIFHPVKNTVTQ